MKLPPQPCAVLGGSFIFVAIFFSMILIDIVSLYMFVCCLFAGILGHFSHPCGVRETWGVVPVLSHAGCVSERFFCFFCQALKTLPWLAFVTFFNLVIFVLVGDLMVI